MERVDDDGTPPDREQGGAVRPTAPAFAVWVCTTSGRTARMMRARRIAAIGSRTGASSRERPGSRTICDAGALGDEPHRLLAARDVAGDERRLVAALREAAREVGHVQRGTAHVQTCDHPQDADRARGHGARAYPYTRAVPVLKTLFWGSLGALAWTHVGYPLAAGRARPRAGAPRRARPVVASRRSA